jgi:hypothetical protein
VARGCVVRRLRIAALSSGPAEKSSGLALRLEGRNGIHAWSRSIALGVASVSVEVVKVPMVAVSADAEDELEDTPESEDGDNPKRSTIPVKSGIRIRGITEGWSRCRAKGLAAAANAAAKDGGRLPLGLMALLVGPADPDPAWEPVLKEGAEDAGAVEGVDDGCPFPGLDPELEAATWALIACAEALAWADTIEGIRPNGTPAPGARGSAGSGNPRNGTRWGPWVRTPPAFAALAGAPVLSDGAVFVLCTG